MLANPTIMSRHPHQHFSWEGGRQIHATYASAGPSKYGQQQPSSWTNNHAGPSSQPISSPNSQNTEVSASTPTAVITANGTTVYAATGRKRKRLQKACVACHKAKRRCDGGLPCSNCDFSGRTCCYSDANGKMVLPTARAGPTNAPQPIHRMPVPAPQEAADCHVALAQPPQTYSESRPIPTAMPSSASSAPFRGPNQTRTSLPHSTVSPSPSPKLGPSYSNGSPSATSSEVSPERRRELISIFFTQIHPFRSVIDEISFLRDLSTSEVSPALLYSMYALAARHLQDVEDHRRFAAGEFYARSARAMLSEEDANGSSALDQPNLETATALCFLSAHEAGMGRLHRALAYSNASVRMVLALKFHEGAIPEARPLPYGRDSLSSNVRRNSCQRLVCVSWALDTLLASLAGQAPSVRAEEIDACLANFRARNNDEVSNTFFSMTQIFAVLVRVLDHARSMRALQPLGSKGLDKASIARAREGADRCEESLHAWAERLTVDERFDETNLTKTSNALSEMEASNTADKAWCWAMMHTVAECSMFILHSSNPIEDDQSRQLAAYNNLLLILESFGANGRQSLFAFPALLICTGFPTRTKLSVSRWLGQARDRWGLGDAQLDEASQSLCISRQAASPALSLPLPQPSTHHSSHHLPRHHASASGSMLPSLGSLPLPALRLSPPTSNGARSSMSDAHELPSLSPLGLRGSPTDLSSWKSSASSSGRASPPTIESTLSQDGTKSPNQGTSSFELYASHNAAGSGGFETRSPSSSAIRSGANLGSASDPRSAWSPIASLRGEKRSIGNVSQ